MYQHRPCHSCGKQTHWQNPCKCQQTNWHQPPAHPIVCPPQYRVRDTFTPRMQPVIHPIVNVNREHIVNVPQHFYTQTNETVVAPGSQNAYPMNNRYPQQGGYSQGGFQQNQCFPGQPRY